MSMLHTNIFSLDINFAQQRTQHVCICEHTCYNTGMRFTEPNEYTQISFKLDNLMNTTN